MFTTACKKPCESRKICNPKSGRCVLKEGSIGKRILKLKSRDKSSRKKNKVTFSSTIVSKQNRMANANTFSVGDIVVCKNPLAAGASRYPVFGKITNITKTGKFRITLVKKLYPESSKNTRDFLGLSKLIKPDADHQTGKSVLAKWIPEARADMLYAGDKATYGSWTKYDPSSDYFDESNFGD